MKLKMEHCNSAIIPIECNEKYDNCLIELHPKPTEMEKVVKL